MLVVPPTHGATSFMPSSTTRNSSLASKRNLRGSNRDVTGKAHFVHKLEIMYQLAAAGYLPEEDRLFALGVDPMRFPCGVHHCKTIGCRIAYGMRVSKDV